MINVISSFGDSFKNLAAYLLNKPERVAFTHTHNLGTDDPELAWKTMVATARMQDTLKRNAGFQVGRRSKGPVMHYILSWSPLEVETVGKEEMIRAALQTLDVLGKKNAKKRAVSTQLANEHQALIVAHHDKGHLHVHVCLSRVHPEHGLMLPSYNDQIRLSDWAYEYRRSMGLEHLTPERVKNAEARRRSRKQPTPGVKVKGKPRVPRHIYELMSRSRSHRHLEVVAEQRVLDQAVAKTAAEVDASQKHDRDSLDRLYAAEIAKIRQTAKDKLQEIGQAIHAKYDRKWMELVHEHDAVLKQHGIRERTWFGRQKNSLKALTSLNLRDLVSSGDRKRILSQVFAVFAKRGISLELLKRRLESETRSLIREQKRDVKAATDEINTAMDAALADNRSRYLAAREDLVALQRIERTTQRSAWARRRKERLAAFAELEPQQALSTAPDVDLPEVFQRHAGRDTQLGESGEDERTRQIEQHRRRGRRSREERRRNRKRRPRRY